MLQPDRTSRALLGTFLASTALLMAATVTNVVPDPLALVALLGWLGCLLGVATPAVRQGGRARAVVEVLLAALIVGVGVGGVMVAGSLRQDEGAERAAVEGFERATDRAVLEAWDLFRDGSCAVVWVHYEGEPPQADMVAVVVTRREGTWGLRGISDRTGDADGFYDEADCLAHEHDRWKPPAE